MIEIKKVIKPAKLKKGDHIRIIAPSRSMKLLSDDVKNEAIKKLKNFGFKLSFGQHVDEMDEFTSSSVESRVNDLHAAFSDKNIDAILTVIGGYNANQMLKYIDYDLIARNPKIICGFSDITALANAINAKTGMITYVGPHFSSWAMKHGFSGSENFFMQCCMNEEPYNLLASDEWSDDMWFIDQQKRLFIKNDGYWIINTGSALGRVVGGHVRCLNALQGTDYWPSLENSILILEEDSEINLKLFDRQLESLIQQKDFKGVRGILIGRFQKENNISKELLIKILSSKKDLRDIPIIANIDFGHTTPLATLPVGGTIEILATDNSAIIKIIEH